MATNQYTRDLFGREVDSSDWFLLEEGFWDFARKYRANGDERAAAIVDRLAKTAADVPAQLVQEWHDLWDVIIDSPAELIAYELIESVAYGYSPDNASSFVLEFIRCVTARAQ